MSNKEMSKIDREILQRRLKERRHFLNMTYQDLADKTGISKSTLQRYETGGIKNLPYDKIFILSEALGVSPNYFTDLSKDYTGESDSHFEMKSGHQRSELLHAIKQFEEKTLKIITPALIRNGYKVEQRSHGSIGDLVATKGNEIWHIDFLYNHDVSKYPAGIGMQRQQLLLRLGRLTVYDKPITKYSIVVDRRIIAEQFLQFNPIHLGIAVSIICLKKNGYEELYLKTKDCSKN